MATSTDSSTVLIVGQRPDPHIDIVAQAIERRRGRVLFLDRLRPSDGLTLRFGHESPGHFVHAGPQHVSLDDITAVWWRMKPSRAADFGFFAATAEDAFATREWSEALRPLAHLVSHARWVNPMEAHLRTGRKVFQLQLARSIGLDIPRTVVSNSSQEVLDAFPEDTNLVYKTLSSFIQPPDHIVFTQSVSKELIARSKPEIARAPGIFQEIVAKRHELRVTIVGRTLFAAEIDSQSHPQTGLDWRRDQGRDMYKIGSISQETSEGLLRFHDATGLAYATYDLIVTPSGKEVFLECNPGGQWLWLEHHLGLNISDALAAHLLAGNRSRDHADGDLLRVS